MIHLEWSLLHHFPFGKLCFVRFDFLLMGNITSFISHLRAPPILQAEQFSHVSGSDAYSTTSCEGNCISLGLTSFWWEVSPHTSLPLYHFPPLQAKRFHVVFQFWCLILVIPWRTTSFVRFHFRLTGNYVPHSPKPSMYDSSPASKVFFVYFGNWCPLRGFHFILFLPNIKILWNTYKILSEFFSLGKPSV